MENSDSLKKAHRRYNPLLKSWITVSPQRIKRPWDGQIDKKPAKQIACAAERDSSQNSSQPSPHCNTSEKQESLQDSKPLPPPSQPPALNPLAPGATRSSGIRNPLYTDTYLFDNDFPALSQPDWSRHYSTAFLDTPFTAQQLAEGGDDHETSEIGESSASVSASSAKARYLYQTRPAEGACKVLCFHADPQLTLATMPLTSVLHVVERWCQVYTEMTNPSPAKESPAGAARYRWVQIFENRGAQMGCSNPHPHCQIWASRHVPDQPRVKNAAQLEYAQQFGSAMLADIADLEQQKRGATGKEEENNNSGSRVVLENDDWLVIVPFWAGWPFETLLLPKSARRDGCRPICDMLDLAEAPTQLRQSLAEILQQLLIRYDNLFECSFPYSMGWHGAPPSSSSPSDSNASQVVFDNNASDKSHWRLHAMFYPPLIRSAEIRKFWVGYELLAEGQRDLTPELAAKMLRSQSGVHYTQRC